MNETRVPEQGPEGQAKVGATYSRISRNMARSLKRKDRDKNIEVCSFKISLDQDLTTAFRFHIKHVKMHMVISFIVFDNVLTQPLKIV